MIKSNYIKLFVFFLGFGLISCAREESPAPVAKKFLEAMQAGDYETASEYSTIETRKLLKQYQKIQLLSGEKQEIDRGAGISIVSEDRKAKSAIVYFKEEGNPIEQKITLVKVEEDGADVWRVDLRKQELDWNNVQMPASIE